MLIQCLGRNCKVFDGVEFEFCDEVNWVMFGNDDLNSIEFVCVYDNYVCDMYENFKKVLVQIFCEVLFDQCYFFVCNCFDCEIVYKCWFCIVSILCCEDVLSINLFVVFCNVNDLFFNGMILFDDIWQILGNNIYFNILWNCQFNDEIKLGLYKEILFCDDICYEVVQFCFVVM